MDAVVAATQRGATTIIGMEKKIILNLICKMSKALLQYGPENVQKTFF